MIRHKDYMYEELHEWSEDHWKRYIATYNLLLEKTDAYIDEVLNALRENDLEEDTIVISLPITVRCLVATA
jgi:arylsulfatase A-like enzyme